MAQERIKSWRDRAKIYGVYVLGFFIIGAAIAFAYLSYPGSFASSFISASLTATLVAITSVYAMLTHQSVHETRQARKQEIKPIIKIEPEQWAIGEGGWKYGLRIKNIGAGPAREIDLKLSLDNSSNEANISRSMLAPEEWVTVSEPFSGEELTASTPDRFENLKVKGDCENSYGDTIEIRALLNRALKRTESFDASGHA